MVDTLCLELYSLMHHDRVAAAVDAAAPAAPAAAPSGGAGPPDVIITIITASTMYHCVCHKMCANRKHIHFMSCKFTVIVIASTAFCSATLAYAC